MTAHASGRSFMGLGQPFFRAVLAAAICSFLQVSDAGARTWKDKTGQFSVEAELVEVKDGSAVLKKADGKVIAVPLERLSDADRAFLAAQPQPEAAPRLGNNYVTFATAGVKLVQPQGFFEVENFEGFHQEETQASIVVVKLPDAYADAAAAFTPQQLKAGGMTFRGKEEVKIDGSAAILVNVTQPAGETTYAKWVLVFGGARETHIVTAMCPIEHEAKLSPLLKAVVLSAKAAE